MCQENVFEKKITRGVPQDSVLNPIFFCGERFINIYNEICKQYKVINLFNQFLLKLAKMQENLDAYTDSHF